MTRDIIRDLTAKKPFQVFAMMSEFNRNAGWAGYFYNGPDATQLSSIAKYEKTAKHGLHITTWHTNDGKLNPADFLLLVTATETFDAKVLGYADDGRNQAIKVARPPIFMKPVTPHITVSWVNNGNPAASGFMQFSEAPANIPPMMCNGTMKVIMQNNREMNLDIFRASIKALEMERMGEIAAKLDPQIRAEIDKHYDTMTWEELKNRFISNGVEFNENLAKLYAQYRADTTDDKMSLSAQSTEAWRADALADKESDEEHEEKNQRFDD